MACQKNGHNASPAVRLPPKVHLGAFETDAVPPYRCLDPVTLAQDFGSGSASTSPTLVRSSSFASTGDQSPVIRSIFPAYDTTLPLSQQSQSSNVEKALRWEKANEAWAKRPNYSPSLYSRPCSGVARQPSGLRTLPSDVLHHCVNKVSTAEELLDLWSLASGQDGRCALASFRLALLWSVIIRLST